MTELRWILLGAGLALIAGIYLWGLRSRRRSAASEPVTCRAIRAAAASRASRPGPDPGTRDRYPADRAGACGSTIPARAPIGTCRSWISATTGHRNGPGRPRAANRHWASGLPPRNASCASRLSIRAPLPTKLRSLTRLAPEEDESEDAVAARAQRIVAIRVTAPAPSRFEGSLLQESLGAEGFEFGRFQIFHRLDPVGRPVISLASLREPGTFDPATMAGAAYAGVALFAVLPGPMPAQQAFEELLVVGRSLAGRLGGNLQDERGGSLSMQRIAQLREEMLTFDRNRASRPAR